MLRSMQASCQESLRLQYALRRRAGTNAATWRRTGWCSTSTNAAGCPWPILVTHVVIGYVAPEATPISFTFRNAVLKVWR